MDTDKTGKALGEKTHDEERSGTRYVAFCDILGFSHKILTDFDSTLEVYKQFGDSLLNAPSTRAEVSVYSDAVLVTSEFLIPVLSTVQVLCFLALIHDLMVRGAITKGRYWEKREGNHMLVASDALARAVKLERSIGVPAVVIADDVEIPDALWFQRFQSGIFFTPILHFRDRNIVNPFNIMWFRSAGDRATRLMAQSPAHKDKYLWFLALHVAIESGHDLIPPDVLARFLRDGILKEKRNDAPGNN